MVPRKAPSEPSNLALRVRSAAVLLPVAALVVWAGGVWFALFVAAILVAMAWEWARLCAPGQVAVVAATAVIGLSVLATVSVALYWPATAIACLGAAVVGAVVRSQGGANRGLAAFGVIYLSAASAGAVWLRGDATAGAIVMLWLIAVIVATDVGAFAAGKTIGGPKLAPAISPNKTWAGLAGAVVCAAVVGGALAAAIGGAPLRSALVGGVLAVVAQAGDLLESKLKRRAGVKDSSGLIPGHGGVLDRLDGVLAAVPALVAYIAFGGAI